MGKGCAAWAVNSKPTTPPANPVLTKTLAGSTCGYALLHPRAQAKLEAIGAVHRHIKRIESRLYDLARSEHGWETWEEPRNRPLK